MQRPLRAAAALAAAAPSSKRAHNRPSRATTRERAESRRAKQIGLFARAGEESLGSATPIGESRSGFFIFRTCGVFGSRRLCTRCHVLCNVGCTPSILTTADLWSTVETALLEGEGSEHSTPNQALVSTTLGDQEAHEQVQDVFRARPRCVGPHVVGVQQLRLRLRPLRLALRPLRRRRLVVGGSGPVCGGTGPGNFGTRSGPGRFVRRRFLRRRPVTSAEANTWPASGPASSGPPRALGDRNPGRHPPAGVVVCLGFVRIGPAGRTSQLARSRGPAIRREIWATCIRALVSPALVPSMFAAAGRAPGGKAFGPRGRGRGGVRALATHRITREIKKLMSKSKTFFVLGLVALGLTLSACNSGCGCGCDPCGSSCDPCGQGGWSSAAPAPMAAPAPAPSGAPAPAASCGGGSCGGGGAACG